MIGKADSAPRQSLKGIGPETADSMLLYAGGYPIFVVDAYTRRIGQRLGLFRFDAYQQVQEYFQSALPQKATKKQTTSPQRKFVSAFGFRPPDFFRPSDFGLRISFLMRLSCF